LSGVPSGNDRGDSSNMPANHSHFSAMKIHSSGLVADKDLLRHFAAALRQKLSVLWSMARLKRKLTLTTLGKQLRQNQIRRKWFV